MQVGNTTVQADREQDTHGTSEYKAVLDCPVQESGRSESAATGKNGRESGSNGVVAKQPGENRD